MFRREVKVSESVSIVSATGAIRKDEKTMSKVMLNFEWVLVELRMPRFCVSVTLTDFILLIFMLYLSCRLS